jgi:large repetitive protein
MKRFTISLFAWLVAILAIQPTLWAQADLCSNATLVSCGTSLTNQTNVGATNDAFPSCNTNGTLATVAPNVWYTFVGNGQTVTVSTCTNTGFDSEIGIFSGSCGALVCIAGVDNDACGSSDETVTFNSVLGTNYFIMIQGHASATGTFSLDVTCSAPAADPCAAPIETITCGSPKSVNLTGSGAGWSPNSCGFSTPGAEKVYSFTPTVTGSYTLQVTAANGTFIDYFFKDASGGCSATGWTCIDDISTPSSVNFGPLTAGTTYLILLDDENTSNSTATFQIDCISPPVDPCAAPIETITCGSPKSVSLTGSGAGWSPNSCGFTTPGAEKVYSFTPTVTGSYTLQVTAANGTFIDYFFKAASGGCSSTGWTCIDDISSPSSISFGPLTAGTTYLILLDDENTSNSTATFQINCLTSVVQLNCPTDITVTAPSGAPNATVSWTAPTATTNCGIGSMTIVQTAGPVSGASFPIGTTAVSFRATDGCGSTATCSFLVTVISCPSITNPSTVAPLCAGATIPNLTASTNATGANAITWVRFNTAQVAPNMYTGGTVLGSSTPAAGVATFTPSAANFPVVGNTTTNYFVYAILNPTPTDPACRPFVAIPVTINPTPTVNAVANQSLCNNQLTTAVSFTGAVPGTTYNWTNNNTSIGLAANGTGNIPAFNAVNTSFATVQVATITVTPVFMDCIGTPTTFTITVQPTPQPALTSTITTVSTAQAACPSIMNDVVLDIRVTNTGNIPLSNIQVLDQLATQFGAAFVSVVSAPTITTTTAATVPTLGGGFNGGSNPRIFAGTNTAGTTGLMNPGEFVTVRIGIRVNPNSNCANPALNNQVSAIGTATACGTVFNVNQQSAVTPLFVPSLMSSLEMVNYVCANDQCANGQSIVSFMARVKNTGNVPLSNVQITNNLAAEMGAGFVNVIPGTLRYAFEMSTAASGPTVNSNFTGTGAGTNLFNNGALLNPCEFMVVVFKVLVNPALGGAGLANQFESTGNYAGTTVSDMSDSGNEPESNNTGASGDTGCSDDATVLCLPTIISAPQDITVDACDTWQADIQTWLNNSAGTVLNNTCNTLVCVVNDYLDHGWTPTSTCGLNQTKLVRFTAKYTDVNGNMSEICFCARVTVVDNTPPSFDMLPMNKVIDCSAGNAAAQIQMWLDSDGGAWVHACSGSATVTNNYNGTLPVCNTPRVVVFTATDNCGRRTSESATLTISDNTPPVISGVPANASVTCISNFPPSANVTSTDLCGTPTMTMTERLENITSRLSGNQEVPARATNASGTFTAEVSTTGAMTMTVNFSGLTTPVTVAHLHTGAFGSNGPVAVDLIPAVLQSGVTSGNFTGTVQLTAAQIASLKAGDLYINIHTSTYPGGEIRGQLGGCARMIRTWTATDACNNTASASQTVTVNDAIAPTITNVPADVTLTCPATASFATPTAADNCGAVALSFTDVTTGAPCPGASTTTRTWTATDMCGNVVTATSRVTITTSTPPPPPSVVTITCAPNQNVIATTGATSAIVTFVGPSATTTCTTGSNITITQISGPTSGSSFPVGTTQVCFRATDACGSTATCCLSVTVVGSTVNPPGSTAIINCSPNINMSAPAGSGGMVVNYPIPTGSTTCTQTGTLNIVQISGLPSGSFFPVGTSTVCYRATDACGGNVTCCFNITVTGGNPPGSGITINIPPNVTINCGQTANLPLATTSTTCAAGGVNVTWVDATNGTSCTGIIYTRTYTATDACGNTATAVYTITQLPDTTPPTWTSLPPQDQMINCGDPINFGTAIATDCSTPVNVTNTVTNNGATSCNAVNGITYGYDLYVHWVATDLCGNMTTATTNIWVLPTTNIAFLSKPVDKDMACSDDMIWEQPMPKSYMADIVNVDFEDDYNLDACGAGTVTRTWTATDALGHTCQAQQVMTILPDNEKPTITLPLSYTTVDCNGNLPTIQPTVSDNCTYVDDLAVTIVETQWGQTIERSYIVTDACGNVNAAVLTISLTDNLAPTFQALPVAKTIACDEPVFFEQAVASDACQVTSLTHTDDVQTTTCSEVHTRTWTAIDANGNTAQAQQVITRTDAQAPAFAADPVDKTVACASEINFDQLTASDACGSVIVYFNDAQTTPMCGASGFAVTRTWTANDGCNNLAQVEQVITVAEDITAPVIQNQFPNVTEITTAQAINWQPVILNVSDNCNTVAVTNAITVIDNCNFSVMYTSTDACGNFSTVEQLVRIIDGACTVLSTDELTSVTMEVYPNPAGNTLTLSLKGDGIAAEYQCEIFDVYGKRVQQFNVNQAKTLIDLTHLNSGAYWLKLTDGNATRAVKFVKTTN